MATGKIRIYDLAKELKLDNKKVLDDARREGIDVSVPSNTVPHEVAERIRAKYFPKKATPKAVPRLVKHAPAELSEGFDTTELPVEQPEHAPVAAAPPEAAPRPAASAPSHEPAKAEPPRPSIRVLKKATPAPQPVEPVVETEVEPAEVEAPAEVVPEKEIPVAPPVVTPPAILPPARAPQRPAQQVRVMRRIPGATPPPPPAATRPGRHGAAVHAGHSAAGAGRRTVEA